MSEHGLDGWLGRDRPGAGDDGSATVWAAAGIAVITGALLIAMHLAAAVAARHRAEATADLAALAAAGLAVQGTDAACTRAGRIAETMGGVLESCRLSGWDALVEVRVPVPLAAPGTGPARGRARAGPVPAPDDLTPVRPAQEAVARGRRVRRRAWGLPSLHRPFRRTSVTFVVTAGPIGDGPWRRNRRRGLLDDVPVSVRWQNSDDAPVVVAPLTAVVPARPPSTPSPEPDPPRTGRRRPAWPPTRPAGGGPRPV